MCLVLVTSTNHTKFNLEVKVRKVMTIKCMGKYLVFGISKESHPPVIKICVVTVSNDDKPGPLEKEYLIVSNFKG